ncbi:GH3 auxin-responsive promoter family protein [Candidatus Woesearchaeota archaeon]|nr:GH3 auxin-responsive promoter family protein [Candidatus Woesearchaeota archaeon]
MQPPLQWVFRSKLFRNALARYQTALRSPRKAQEKLLLYIVKRNRKTAYGRKYGFSDIKTVREYQKRVPVVSYEDLQPYVDCMLQGMRNVLVKDKVVFFATTSGSTSRPKLIPVTNTRRKQLHQELLLWMFFLMKKKAVRKGVKGKTLYFAGPYHEDISQGGILMGSISGYMAWKTPFWAKAKMVVPPEVYNEMDFDKKTRIIALKALSTKNITQVGFAAPIEVILFFDYIKRHRRSLLNELKRSGKRWRARQLEKLDEFIPATIWPNLCLANCIKSDTNLPYLDVLREKAGIPDLTIRDPGIYASEGRLTLGLTDDDRTGVVVAQENFFEFMEQKGKDEYKDPVTIDKVKEGRKYKVVVTTQEGLYRYDMGDVVEVVGFKGRLPAVRFVQRDHFLNIVGEFCPENQLLAAMDAVEEQEGLGVKEFTFFPHTRDLEDRPRYEVLLELGGEASDKSLRSFAKALDEELKRRVQDYRQMREEFGRLGHLSVAVVEPGSYRELEKERLQRAGQPKPVRVAKDVSFRDRFSIVKRVVVG